MLCCDLYKACICAFSLSVVFTFLPDFNFLTILACALSKSFWLVGLPATSSLIASTIFGLRSASTFAFASLKIFASGLKSLFSRGSLYPVLRRICFCTLIAPCNSLISCLSFASAKSCSPNAISSKDFSKNSLFFIFYLSKSIIESIVSYVTPFRLTSSIIGFNL